MHDILKAYAVNNACYKAAKPMKPAGIVVHSTGANNPYLKRYVDSPAALGVNRYGNHWNVPRPGGQEICVHAFIGYDKDKRIRVAEILPLNICCWGVGSGAKGSYNFNPPHIQFEICEDDLTDRQYYTAAFEEAAAYCAHLCKTYQLPVSSIVSHREAAVKGYGSNHGDPETWMRRHGDTMDAFRSRVQRLLQTATVKPAASKPVAQDAGIHAGTLVSIAAGAVYMNGKAIPQWVQKQRWYVKAEPVNGRAVLDRSEDGKHAINSPVNVRYLTAAGTVKAPAAVSAVPYRVKVSVVPLAIRKGPRETFLSSGSITSPGVYTIVEESGKWGRLKSGAGWISLENTKKYNPLCVRIPVESGKGDHDEYDRSHDLSAVMDSDNTVGRVLCGENTHRENGIAVFRRTGGSCCCRCLVIGFSKMAMR